MRNDSDPMDTAPADGAAPEADPRDAAPVAATRLMARPSPPPVPAAGDPEAVRLLERHLRSSRIVIALLAVIAVLLAAALALALSGALAGFPATSADVPAAQAQPSSPEPSDDEAAEGGSSRDDAAGQDAGDGHSLTAAGLSEIIGEKWSNAKRILEAYGVDPADLVVITDDGSRVMDDSNWTVTLVADLDDTGEVAVHLRHDTVTWWDSLAGGVGSILS